MSDKPPVLIVDDCTDLLTLFKVVIKTSTKRSVITARSLAEIKTLGDRVTECDAAILDINLGVDHASGIDIYHWLRAQGFKGKVIFLTGHADNHPLVKEAAAFDNVHVFLKPIETQTLIEMLQ